MCCVLIPPGIVVRVYFLPAVITYLLSAPGSECGDWNVPVTFRF